MAKLIIYLLLIYQLFSAFTGWSLTLSSVNGGPQISSDDKNFGTYWAFWLKLDNEEKRHIRSIISRRTVQLETRSCMDQTTRLQGSESFYFYDNIQLDQNGMVIPLREAMRTDYRYISLMNITGLRLTGEKGLNRVKRLPGENYDQYTKRKSIIRQEWRKKAFPKGNYGEIYFKLELKAYSKSPKLQSFVRISDYLEPSSELYDLFVKYKPDAWPIHYDERAHKPHHIREPELWSKKEDISKELEFKFIWNWCNEKVSTEIVFLSGDIPEKGPNRNGRPGGSSLIPIRR